MARKESVEKYKELFDTDEKKAKAFDKIAEKYYFSNFGSTSKSDLDVLMFSIYIEEILEKTKNDFSTYSDYTLSKNLGITQARVSNLKVKKELIYPYSEFSWKEALLSISGRAVYENGKIMLFVPDKNVFIEIKNAVECMGGYIEIQMTSNLLQVRLAYFLDLLVSISENKTRADLRQKIKKRIEDTNDVSIIEKEPFGKALLKQAPETIISIIGDCIPVFGGVVKDIAMAVYKSIR